MDEKTLSALTTLAQQLGTTSQYLWSVLLKQAAITGAIDLAAMTAFVAAEIWWFCFVRRKTATPHETLDRYPRRPEWDQDVAMFAWASVACFGLLVALGVAPILSTTFAALFNPEYWALKQILK